MAGGGAGLRLRGHGGGARVLAAAEQVWAQLREVARARRDPARGRVGAVEVREGELEVEVTPAAMAAGKVATGLFL